MPKIVRREFIESFDEEQLGLAQTEMHHLGRRLVEKGIQAKFGIELETQYMYAPERTKYYALNLVEYA